MYLMPVMVAGEYRITIFPHCNKTLSIIDYKYPMIRIQNFLMFFLSAESFKF